MTSPLMLVTLHVLKLRVQLICLLSLTASCFLALSTLDTQAVNLPQGSMPVFV